MNVIYICGVLVACTRAAERIVDGNMLGLQPSFIPIKEALDMTKLLFAARKIIPVFLIYFGRSLHICVQGRARGHAAHAACQKLYLPSTNLWASSIISYNIHAVMLLYTAPLLAFCHREVQLGASNLPQCHNGNRIHGQDGLQPLNISGIRTHFLLHLQTLENGPFRDPSCQQRRSRVPRRGGPWPPHCGGRPRSLQPVF